MSNNTKTISDAFQSIFDELDNEDNASVNNILDAFGDRAYGPFLFVTGLLIVSPIAAIPGVSILFGIVVILVAGQYFIKQDAPWIPASIKQRSISADKAKKKLEPVSHYLEKLDKVIKPRFEVMVSKPMRYVAMLTIVCLGFTIFPLAAVPWGVMLPGLAICCISLAIVARDGVMMVLGLLVSLGALYGLYQWVL